MAGQRNGYGKRSSRPDYDDEGGKRRNSGGVDRETYVPGPDDTVYRYLCQGKKIGSIIGRGGEIVKQLRADTHAKIRIGETVQRCDERVITIFSTSKETNPSAEAGDDVCPAQDALFRVHEKLVTEDNIDEGSDDGSSQITARLLVPSDQIGSLIGKGGQIIQGIRSDTGAQIRIMKNEHLPACAIATDELVQITGEASAVRKALVQVSSRLHDNPSRSQHLLTSYMSSAYPTNDHYGGPIAAGPLEVLPMMPSYGGYKGEQERDWAPYYPPRRDENSVKEFSLRLLCAASNIGGLIGKGGGIIKQIRQESGAYIKIDNSSSEDDSIISISAKELFEDPSPAIDAAVRIQHRCSEVTEKESEESSYTTRLLVQASRIGCLIGKGGSIISEMRRSTRANIRILSKENLPKVASDDEEMVQISGDRDVSRDALVQVTTRLKANFFDMEGALSAMPFFPYHPVAPEPSHVSKYAGRESKSHDRGYSSYSSGYGSSHDLPHSDSYRSYGGSQAGASGYGAYSGYSGHSGSSGLSGPTPVSHGKYHGC